MNNIKKAVMGGVAGATMLASTMMPVLAAQPNPSADNGLMMNGQSEVRHLELYQKDPSTLEIVASGARGKMTFDLDSFIFNGKGLEAGVEYSLIYYPDPWPGTNLVVLGEGTANSGGNVNIKGDFDFTSIPNEDDENDGAKIWLVLSEDVDIEAPTKMIGWHPDQYLFEYDVIN